jgi:uncharacterized protein YndB with AHSA1/START domain
MNQINKTPITVEASINSKIDKVWECWISPRHITQWNNASEDWHTTRAENDLRPGGKFLSRMESKDGTMGFDFEGIYDKIVPEKLIEYTMLDGRNVRVVFSQEGSRTTVEETFDPESTNSPEMQKNGWQAILDNFKRYVESVKK